MSWEFMERKKDRFTSWLESFWNASCMQAYLFSTSSEAFCWCSYKAWGCLLGKQLSERDIIVACIDYRWYDFTSSINYCIHSTYYHFQFSIWMKLSDGHIRILLWYDLVPYVPIKEVFVFKALLILQREAHIFFNDYWDMWVFP